MLGDDEGAGAVIDESVMSAGRNEKEIARARRKGRRRRAPDLIRSAQDELSRT
jgi:hypothetical protein